MFAREIPYANVYFTGNGGKYCIDYIGTVHDNYFWPQ